MPSKNSLASFKLHDKKILPNKDEVEKQRSSQENAQAGGSIAPKKTQNVPFSMRFTEDEMNTIRAKAGRIPIATYLKDLLRDETSLFKQK